MGRTLASFTQLVINEQDSLAKFRRALRKEDQAALDDLFRAARYHVAACAYASDLLPFETMLLAMLIEEHKRVQRLQVLLERWMEHAEVCDARAACPPIKCFAKDTNEDSSFHSE